MIKALFQYTFLQNAVAGALLASIVCGIIGTIIIEKKLVMMSGGIAHISFGGIGMGYYFNIEPIFGGLVIAVLASLGISAVNRKTRTPPDALVGMFWSAGMALGILFIALTPGYPPDMTSYLFGDILTVSRTYIKLILVLDTVILVAVISLFNYWKAYMFDEEFAAIQGIGTVYLEYFLFVLIALTIIVIIKVVGIILVMTLLTVPASIARLFTYDLKRIMLVSVFLGMALCLTGLFLSYRFNLPSGAAIALLSTTGYFVSAAFRKIMLPAFRKTPDPSDHCLPS